MFVCCQLSEGGWVAVQARGQYGNPSDFFARDLAEYERGFGNPGAEFWLGLDRLAASTGRRGRVGRGGVRLAAHEPLVHQGARVLLGRLDCE